MSTIPEIWAFEHEAWDGELYGKHRLIEAGESMTVMDKSPDDKEVKVKTQEGWIAWIKVEDLVKITLN